MRKQQIENAAYNVATQVRTVEDTIDAALAEIAELQARHARQLAGPRKLCDCAPRARGTC